MRRQINSRATSNMVFLSTFPSLSTTSSASGVLVKGRLGDLRGPLTHFLSLQHPASTPHCRIVVSAISSFPVRSLTTVLLTLTDDKILIQMGSVREGQTDEEKATYLAGLKEIINEMRRDKVKEFSTVASEIAAYRRRFLQDPSRVLPL